MCVCPLMPLATPTILLGFLLPWRGVSLHGCSSKAQPLLLTLEEGYLLTAVPDLQHGIVPPGPPAPCAATAPCVVPPGCWPWPWAWLAPSSCRPLALGSGWLLPASTGLGHGVSPSSRPWPRMRGSSSPPPLTLDEGYLLTAGPLDLESGVAPLGPPAPRSRCSLDMG